MKKLKHFILRIAMCLGIAGAAPAAHAGIPVIDVAGLAQAIEQVLNSITQIENQVSQIRQLHAQYEAITGTRNLGALMNNPLLQNYVPRDAAQTIRNIESGGYSGLAGSARALRDARMTYNCLDLAGDLRIQCQSDLARGYQQKAFMQDALEKARDRTAQINALMQQVNATTDQKGALEIQARIAAENALLQHELTQVNMARGMAEAELRIAESRAREAQLEQASRTGRLSDFVPR